MLKLVKIEFYKLRRKKLIWLMLLSVFPTALLLCDAIFCLFILSLFGRNQCKSYDVLQVVCLRLYSVYDCSFCTWDAVCNIHA